MTAAPKLEPLLTPEEVAGILKVSLSTVYTLARTSALPGRRVGVQWRFRREDVEAYMRGDPGPGAPTPISAGRRRRV